MRKFIGILATAGLVALSVVSCGSKKVATSTNTGDVALQDEPCISYAMEKPAQRAYGVGLHFQESTANNLAELNARTKLARALQSCIKTGSKNSGTGTTVFSADDVSGSSATDQSGTADDLESGFAKELIRSAVVVKMTRYKTPNNQFRIYVCLEYKEGVAEMAGKIAKSVNDKLSPEQRAKAKFDEEKFRQELEKAMNDYKGATTD